MDDDVSHTRGLQSDLLDYIPPSKQHRTTSPASSPSTPSAVGHHIDGPISHPLADIAASVSLLDGSIIYQGRRYTLAAVHPSTHPILGLRPVRSVLHPFLTDKDAARLLRAGRTTTLALLPGFTFTQHVFEGKSQQQMLRMRALYEAYDMQPTQMCLSRQLQSLWLKEGSGRSPFPLTLTSLLLGPMVSRRTMSTSIRVCSIPRLPCVSPFGVPGRG